MILNSLAYATSLFTFLSFHNGGYKILCNRYATIGTELNNEPHAERDDSNNENEENATKITFPTKDELHNAM